MKLNSGFLTHNDGDNKLLVSTGATKFSGLVRSNQTAGFIIECLEQNTNEDEIVAKMQKKCDENGWTIAEYVENIGDMGKVEDIGDRENE